MRVELRIFWRVVVGLFVLAIVGGIMSPLTNAGAKRDGVPTGSRDTRIREYRQSLWGSFGDLRADLEWVRSYERWRDRDLEGVRKSLELVGHLSPRNVPHWINGARILGYDAAAWRIQSEGSDRSDVIQIEQMNEAIRHLDQGRQQSPDRFEFRVEEAVLRMRLSNDLSGALVALESLENFSGVPYYVGRVRGELLVRLGRKDAALDWLKRFEKTLPAEDPDARKEIVQRRITLLEEELNL